MLPPWKAYAQSVVVGRDSHQRASRWARVPWWLSNSITLTPLVCLVCIIVLTVACMADRTHMADCTIGLISAEDMHSQPQHLCAYKVSRGYGETTKTCRAHCGRPIRTRHQSDVDPCTSYPLPFQLTCVHIESTIDVPSTVCCSFRALEIVPEPENVGVTLGARYLPAPAWRSFQEMRRPLMVC
jgi:hypothetical protein